MSAKEVMAETYSAVRKKLLISIVSFCIGDRSPNDVL